MEEKKEWSGWKKFWHGLAITVIGGVIVFILNGLLSGTFPPWHTGPESTSTPPPHILSFITFEAHEFAKDQKFNVYTYPSESSWYSKTKNGDPVYSLTSEDEISVAGYDNGWLLISYPTDKGPYRIGYTKDASGVPINLKLDNYPGEITENCNLSDGVDNIPLSKGTQVIVLGKINEKTNEGIYVEVTVEGKKARGIIPLSSVNWE